MADSINLMLDEMIDDLKFALEKAILCSYECADSELVAELKIIQKKYFGKKL